MDVVNGMQYFDREFKREAIRIKKIIFNCLNMMYDFYQALLIGNRLPENYSGRKDQM